MSDSPDEEVVDDAAPEICSVCLVTPLTEDHRCVLRCNRCLPQLETPRCPLCRRSIWPESPWLLDAAADPSPFQSLFLQPLPTHAPPGSTPPVSETDTTTPPPEEEHERIPVMLLTRDQIQRIFHH